jgi:hypothetical protein
MTVSVQKLTAKIRQYKCPLYWAVVLLVLAPLAALYLSNDYMTPRDVNVTVDAKMILAAQSRKSHDRPMISYWNAEEKILFDREVSVGTFASAVVGEKRVVYVRPFDMKQTGKQNLLFFFLPVFFASVVGALIIAPLIERFLIND